MKCSPRYILAKQTPMCVQSPQNHHFWQFKCQTQFNSLSSLQFYYNIKMDVWSWQHGSRKLSDLLHFHCLLVKRGRRGRKNKCPAGLSEKKNSYCVFETKPLHWLVLRLLYFWVLLRVWSNKSVLCGTSRRKRLLICFIRCHHRAIKI